MCALLGASFAEGVRNTKGSASSSQVTEFILANNTIWTILINGTKASILAQYLRIFHSHSKRIACYLLLFALIPAACWETSGGIFLCKPTAKLWTPVLDGRCGKPETYWLSVAAADIFLDFAVLILPMPSIAGLRLPNRQKIATVLVFVLGFLVCLVSVVRVATVLITSRRGDYVRSGIWAIVWSAVEANVGIICACLLSLKALVTKLFPRLLDEEDVNPRHMRVASVPEEWRPGDSEAATLARSVGSRELLSMSSIKCRQ
ncbi:hypothetical protein Slin15195_G048300 [Septoria linicola]|uniref:Rhodopsin domain-containing protein n=1 Tax=Septoria linicola TaxID=215465 RepID=A0A9Q9EH69_9PEZI|nr:hypothetical protein Slin15195_G048300 [Septoria linicola]